MTPLNPFRILKNAGANVARGVAAALVALVLPPLLTRSMSPAAYGAWALVLQLSAYIVYLDFGIQTAVGRFVAYGKERSDRDYCDRMVSTAVAALAVAGLLGLMAAAVAALLLPQVFHQMPPSLLGQARAAVVLVAGSLAIGLPFAAFNGVFVGLHRYDIPALTVGGSRVLSAVFLVLVVRHGGSLLWMGVAVAAVNLLGYSLQYGLYRQLASGVCLRLSSVALRLYANYSTIALAYPSGRSRRCWWPVSTWSWWASSNIKRSPTMRSHRPWCCFLPDCKAQSSMLYCRRPRRCMRAEVQEL